MRIVKGLEELQALVGQEIGYSDWIKIEQDRIQAFADATLDHQWIHLDEEKAKKMSPFGTTIAHGFLTLSLMPYLMDQVWKIEGAKMGVNYGTNKVRFMSPVPVNSKVRLKATLSSLEEIEGGVQMVVTATYEREGQEKPVCVAEAVSRLYF